jgi:hypothetical protein
LLKEKYALLVTKSTPATNFLQARFMATLVNSMTSEKIVLRPFHVFGRHAGKADTVLASRDISQIHASIRWHEHDWQILDQSRNGTSVNGKSLHAGNWSTLQESDLIRFGQQDAAPWQVEDVAAPRPLLWPVSDAGAAIELTSSNNLLPPANPQISIYVSHTGQWVLENNDEIAVLRDGDLVKIGEQSWKFVSAEGVQTTLSGSIDFLPSASAALTFHFQTSRNEEHVWLRLQEKERQIDLGERIHHYCLMTLARKRMEDAQRGLDANSQGWIAVEELSRMLGIDAQHVNVQIFRARSQVLRALPAAQSLPHIVDRRRGEVRFGSHKFKIMRGSSIECEFEPEYGKKNSASLSL